jgi:hypothetical protein
LAVLAAACGNGSTASSGTDACTLLTVGEIQSASGLTVGSPTHPNYSHNVNLNCHWSAGNGTDLNERYVELSLDPGAKLYDVGKGSPIPNLGLAAKLDSTVNQVDVKLANLAFYLIIVDDAQQNSSLASEETTLAKLVVPRVS